MPTQQDEDTQATSPEKLFYESTNGDRWYLGQDPATGSRAVKHVANPQSGGHISYQDIASFLARGQGTEQQALKHLINGEQATILIAYDIHPAEGTAYHDLVNAIQTLGAWWHHLETVWIIRSDRTPDQLRDHLEAYIGPSDQLLILDITGAKAGWAGISDAGSSWLKEKIGGGAVVLRD